jgi:hypothetical protein
MTVKVVNKFGKEIHKFFNVDEVREYEGYYEIVMEGDLPWCRVYGKKNVILIKY